MKKIYNFFICSVNMSIVNKLPSRPKKIEWIFLILPMIAVYTASAFCDVGKSSGSTVKFRPPAYVFGIVWPILLIHLGISWVLASRQNKWNSVLYTALVLSLVSWLIVYECDKNKIGGVWNLAVSVLLAVMCLIVGNTSSRLILAPILGWLIFAMQLNINEVSK